MSEFPVDIPDEFRHRFFLDGDWVRPAGDRRTTLFSPATERETLALPLADGDDVRRAVAAARTAFDTGPWPRMPAAERSAYLVRLAEEVRGRLPLLARLWTARGADGLVYMCYMILSSPVV